MRVAKESKQTNTKRRVGTTNATYTQKNKTMCVYACMCVFNILCVDVTHKIILIFIDIFFVKFIYYFLCNLDLFIEIMSSQLIRSGRPVLKEVKAVLSTNREEARRRVLNLYKLWYRQAPYVGRSFHLI